MNAPKCPAEMHTVCSNSALCHLCDGVRLFKDPVAEKKEKLRIREEKKAAEKTALLKSYSKEKKEGMAFEKRVAKRWNDRFGDANKKKPAKPRLDTLFESEPETPTEPTGPNVDDRNFKKPAPKRYTRPEAQRQKNSGALWNAKGDIKLEHALLECKERGTKNSRGEKTISIPKEWITKQEQEAFQESRDYWYIPFGYKNEDGIYLVKDFDHEIEMIYEMRRLREENENYRERLGENE